ncbi:MAG: 2-amino-4-hydroxy-6-hydroxymethyldihydropteridine diphosphokinase [Pirellulaceae bacterium]
MPHCLISLGANLGHPRESLKAAWRMLQESFGGDPIVASHIYRTPPVGGPSGQGEFLNAMVSLQTDADPCSVWRVLRTIEERLGRKRQHRWEARAIDLDLILHGDQRIWTPHFKIPHPRMAMRRFVLAPAVEIAPGLIDPVTGWTIAKLLQQLEGSPREIQVIASGFGSLDLGTDQPFRGWRPLLCAGSRSILRRSQPAVDRLLRVAESQLLREAWEDAAGQRRIELIRLPQTWTPDTCLRAIAKDPTNPSDLLSWQVDQSNETDPVPPLLIAAVGSPDPESIAWEDYSLPWARWMGLSPASSGGTGTLQAKELGGADRKAVDGPRYLMPLGDPAWAKHELLAAWDAMECPITVDAPLATP